MSEKKGKKLMVEASILFRRLNLENQDYMLSFLQNMKTESLHIVEDSNKIK